MNLGFDEEQVYASLAKDDMRSRFDPILSEYSAPSMLEPLTIESGNSKDLDLSSTYNSLEVTSEIALVGLLATSIITILGAINAGNDRTEHGKSRRRILILESTVNIIASYFYLSIIKNLKTQNYSEASNLRYLDWFLTVPVLLISFLYYLRNQKQECKNQLLEDENAPYHGDCEFPMYRNMGLVAASIVMLSLGAAGRTNNGATQNKSSAASVLGFFAFSAIPALLYTYDIDQYIAITVFTLVWFLYGIVYYLPVRQTALSREGMYNILDLVSKAGFGVFIYFFVNQD